MKKYFLAIASFFIYSHISLGQVYPGQMDSTFVPVRSHHYDPELTFDFCVNEPLGAIRRVSIPPSDQPTGFISGRKYP